MLQYVGVGKVLQKRNADVDNFMMFCHYRITFLAFLISSLMVTAPEYFGNPIDCITKSGDVSAIINSYCYIMSTFSMPRSWAKVLGKSVAYPGLGSINDLNRNVAKEGKDLVSKQTGNADYEDDEIVYHSYYLWVPFVLFVQAVLFYVPRYIWKHLEGGLFRTVLGGLDHYEVDGGVRIKEHKMLTKYMIGNLNTHMTWAAWFFLCEALCLVNVVGNIYFTDFFLGGTFLKYGTEVINFPDMDPETRVDPMIRIFPKLTKCTFRKYGASGTIETHDAMCLLAVNIINEKIYIFLWFWLVILTVITSLWLVYRLGVIVSSALRKKLLEVIDPWGTVVAKTSEGVGVAFAEVNLSYLESVRKSMPVFTHRRNDLYFLSMEPRLHQHPR